MPGLTPLAAANAAHERLFGCASRKPASGPFHLRNGSEPSLFQHQAAASILTEPPSLALPLGEKAKGPLVVQIKRLVPDRRCLKRAESTPTPVAPGTAGLRPQARIDRLSQQNVTKAGSGNRPTYEISSDQRLADAKPKQYLRWTSSRGSDFHIKRLLCLTVD